MFHFSGIRRPFRVAAGLLLALSLTACGSGSSASSLKKVNIALMPNVTDAQALIGKNNGTFAKSLGSGVSISWRSFNAGPDEIQAFLTGAEDIGYIGPGPALTGYVQSHGDIQIISGSADGGMMLVARSGTNIQSVKDLSGKKVAIPQFGNTQHLLLLNLLKKNGLKTTDKGGTVTVEQVTNADVQAMFERGTLDAALVPEPWGTTLVKKSGARIVLDEKSLWMKGQYATTVVIARKEFIRKHPDIVEKFLEAHVSLTELVQKEPVSAQKAVNAQMALITGKKLSASILASSFQNLSAVYDPSKTSVLAFKQFAQDAGYLKSESGKDLFDLSILNKVLKADGKTPVS